jgi:hypothetical protein
MAEMSLSEISGARSPRASRRSAAPWRRFLTVTADDQFFGRNYQVGIPTAPQLTGVKRKTANIDIRVKPELVAKINAWRARQRVPPSRSSAIVYILEEFLKHDPPELNAAWHKILSRA